MTVRTPLTVVCWLLVPTATQNVALTHDTPLSPLSVAPAAFGLGTTDQPDGSGRSTKVTVTPFGFVY